MTDYIRIYSMEIVDISLRLRGQTLFKQYEAIKRIQKLNDYLAQEIKTATPAGLEVITYASNVANRSIMGNKIDVKSCWQKLLGLIGEMEKPLN